MESLEERRYAWIPMASKRPESGTSIAMGAFTGRATQMITVEPPAYWHEVVTLRRFIDAWFLPGKFSEDWDEKMVDAEEDAIQPRLNADFKLPLGYHPDRRSRSTESRTLAATTRCAAGPLNHHDDINQLRHGKSASIRHVQLGLRGTDSCASASSE